MKILPTDDLNWTTTITRTISDTSHIYIKQPLNQVPIGHRIAKVVFRRSNGIN